MKQYELWFQGSYLGTWSGKTVKDAVRYAAHVLCRLNLPKSSRYYVHRRVDHLENIDVAYNGYRGLNVN